MSNMMRPTFPTRTKIIYTHTVGDTKTQYKGTVLSYQRVPGTDFFKYTVSVFAQNAQTE